MAEMNLVQAINLALGQEMQRDQSVVVMGEDVGVDGGVFRATEGLIAKFGAERVIDTPLSESGIIGSAIGMAIAGLKPVAEIQFSGFIYPAFEQIISHAARIRNRSRGRFTCPLVIRSPYGAGIRALEHHQESTEVYFAHTPGIKVVMPSNPYDAKGLLAASIRDPDPVIFYESLKLYRAFKMEVPEKDYEIEIGKAGIARKGKDLTIVSFGAMMRPSLEAAEELQQEGISAEVVDLKTVNPLDLETVIKSVEKTGRLLVVHEAPRTCGMGAEICARVAEKALLELKAPVSRVTGYDTMPPLAKLENYYLPDANKIMIEAKRIAGF
ncbi:MAG: alpha-ketoacid dehydrogenase subunit beta [archaeon]